LGDIDNISECAFGWFGYSDFTHLSTELAMETDTPITITIEYGEAGDEGGLWIDWNQDYDFDDDGEAIALSGTPGEGPYTASISPPPGAPLGETRMRVRVVRDHAPEPCGEQDAGEVEDYTIIVVEGQDCPADFDGDGDVDTADLLFLLGAWRCRRRRRHGHDGSPSTPWRVGRVPVGTRSGLISRRSRLDGSAH
jgi:hypothetical protein